MSWNGSVRRMVLEDMVEAARLRGAKSPDDEVGDVLSVREPEKRATEIEAVPGKRGVVRRRAA